MSRVGPQGVMENFNGQHSQQEIRLFESSKERVTYDNLADLYTIVLATEHLERAYARDAITQKEYTTECHKLLSQFRLAEKAALGKNMTIETFMQIYQMDCPRAVERLLKMGTPEHVKSSTDDGNHVAVTVAETVQFFITTMDAVRLEQKAVDELQPLLSELMDALTRFPDTPGDFEPMKTIEGWLKKLNSMRAIDEIDDDDARQLCHDLESAYAEFTRYLKREK
mmetsp:Transcript_17750/g.25053  ORF Transcript_17750/g.25053 Transcript_17750/m.25053 type:complete len:225 (-) Transcript_17750:526-1200(-)